MIKSLRVLLSSLAVAALLACNAQAQDKPDPNAGKKDQPPAAGPQKAPEKSPEKPRADEPRQTEKPMPEKPSTDRPADPPRAGERPSGDTTQRQQQAQDPNRDTERPGADRSQDTGRDRRPSTDRSSRDTGRDAPRSSEQTGRDQKQLSASDLGFSFSEESSEKGLKISKTKSDTLATKAKFKEGDIIVRVNDNRVRSQADFIRFIHAAPRERITVIVLRDEEEVTLYLEPELIQEFVVTSGGAWLGVDLYDRFSRAAVVLKVHPNSPAERAGLRSDDLIISVEGTGIRSPEHLGEVIRSMDPGTDVEILVERNRREQVVDATLGRKENVVQRTPIRQRSLLPRR
jgi:hypothetical protein